MRYWIKRIKSQETCIVKSIRYGFALNVRKKSIKGSVMLKEPSRISENSANYTSLEPVLIVGIFPKKMTNVIT